MMPEGTQTCGVCKARVDRYVTSMKRDTGEVTAITCEECDKAKRFKEYLKTKHITTWTMMDASLIAHDVRSGRKPRETDPEIIQAALAMNEATDRLHTLAKTFEKEVWYAGLQKIVVAASSALSEDFTFGAETVAFRILCTAGRCLMTLDTPTADITLITAEDEPPNSEGRGPKPLGEGPMGIQGLHATEEQATALINAVIARWKVGLLKLEENQHISII